MILWEGGDDDRRSIVRVIPGVGVPDIEQAWPALMSVCGTRQANTGRQGAINPIRVDNRINKQTALQV
jgi:hypothetical protein